MEGGIIMRVAIAFIIFTVVGTIFCGSTYASDELQSGSRYKILKPLYLVVEYYSADDKRVCRETARAYLTSIKVYKTRWVAFQVEVPAGTVMTIIGQEQRAWYLFFAPTHYFVGLDPDPSHGLDIMLNPDLGFEGTLDGLNPELFSRL